MKISLNLGPQNSDAHRAKILEADILAAKRGDWTAKNNLARQFSPLLQSLAAKRSSSVAESNAYIEAGKAGLYAAAKKYKPDIGSANFQTFALDFIESRMDKVAQGGGGGLLSRLFGR